MVKPSFFRSGQISQHDHGPASARDGDDAGADDRKKDYREDEDMRLLLLLLLLLGLTSWDPSYDNEFVLRDAFQLKHDPCKTGLPMWI